MKTITQADLIKFDVISNIQNMRKIIGLKESSFEFLLKKSYDELHEEQNSLIEHYNQAIRNKNNNSKK